jgi:hypothetical protein
VVLDPTTAATAISGGRARTVRIRKDDGNGCSMKPTAGQALTLRWHLHYLPRRIRRRRHRAISAHLEYLDSWYRLRWRRAYLNVQPASITVLITSAGRLECLQKTVETLRANIDVRGFERVCWMIIDDDPHDTVTRRWILEHGAFDVAILPPRNLQLGSALNLALSEVSTEYVFHSEDDWQYLTKLPLNEFADLLSDGDLHAEQVLAYREPVAPLEREYPGAVQIRSGLGFTARYSFNPHMFSLQGYLRHGPIPVFRDEEEEYSARLRSLNANRALIFNYRRTPMVRHIGYQSKLIPGRSWPQRSPEWVAAQYQ